MSFTIKNIAIKDFVDYASSDIWENARIIPITRERALSQQKNPYAREMDQCLWVASADQDGEVIGFCGSLPGMDPRSNTRIAWNSCWWVDPDRGREAAMPLFYHFLKAWDFKVAFADMTPHTRTIVDQMGFCHTREETLIHSYLRIPLSNILNKQGFAGKLFLLLIVLPAMIVNRIQVIRIGLAGRKKKGLNVESRDCLDEELFNYIRQHRDSDFTGHSQEVFSWIEQNPWLVHESEANSLTDSKYPFSYTVKDYSRKWLVSRRNGEITSVSMISVRDGSLKVLYHFSSHPSDSIKAIKTFISTVPKIHSLVYAHPDLISYRREFRPLVLITKIRKRYTGVSKELSSVLPDKMVMQMGDGDAVFT